METARLILAGGLAARDYTAIDVNQMLDQEQANVEHGVQNMRQVLDVQIPAVLQKAVTGLPTARERRILQSALQEIQDIARQGQNDLPERQFFPQSIPFYAATQAFIYFKKQNPHFEHFDYKEAALNPTNPRDRTTDWEAGIVDFFRNHPLKTEYPEYRPDTPVGRLFTLSKPIRAESSCLACHGRAEDAPPGVKKMYGSANGFNWQLNDVIGAQIVSVPAEVAHNRAAAAMRTILIWLGGVFAGLYAIVNIIAFVFISPRVTAQAAP
jgi:hypothetical protein